MKITVLNGSPKGDRSITLQTVLYLQKHYPQHEFTIIPAAAHIRQYERSMAAIIPQLEAADLLLFAYPVYTFLLPAQLHRFIELMKAECEKGNLHLIGKYVTQLTTSKHFYDITAHTFLQENAEDMGMRYVRGLSADMEDLPKASGQKQALDFMAYVEWNMEKGYWERPLHGEEYTVEYVEEDVEEDPEEEPAQTAAPAENAGPHSKAWDFTWFINDLGAADPSAYQLPLVVVTDCSADQPLLAQMIIDFLTNLHQKKPALPLRIINIRDLKLQGGCLGCLKCAASGKCVYKDGFANALRDRIQQSHAIVYAFAIRDHSMGSLFKMYDDRQFCNGHRTVTMGHPVGYLIEGNYLREPNLKTVLEARSEAGSNFLCGPAFSEDPAGLQTSIELMAEKLCYAIEHEFTPPSNFYGVGGMKIFRDLIYQMQGLMKEDHKFFKQHDQYDFPHNHKGTILAMYLVGALFSSPLLMKLLNGQISEGMLAPYKKVLSADPSAEAVAKVKAPEDEHPVLNTLLDLLLHLRKLLIHEDE